MTANGTPPLSGLLRHRPVAPSLCIETLHVVCILFLGKFESEIIMTITVSLKL